MDLWLVPDSSFWHAVVVTRLVCLWSVCPLSVASMPVGLSPMLLPGLSPVSCLFVCSSEVADRLVVLSDRVLPFTDRTGPFVRDPSVSRSMCGIALVSQHPRSWYQVLCKYSWTVLVLVLVPSFLWFLSFSVIISHLPLSIKLTRRLLIAQS